MVAITGVDIDRFLARPQPARPVVLIFGEDAGLVSERVKAIITASVEDANDPFALVRLDGDEIAAAPARLVEEAQTIPLFGGRRAVWVKCGSRTIVPAVEAVLALYACECRIVVEAGELRRNAPLRALCESARNAAAIACYPDTAGDVARLVDVEMRAAGLTLAPDARRLLVSLIGGDRAASRSEIDKLLLYARGRAEIGVDDVAAVVTDASGSALIDIADAAFGGRTADVEAQLAKARAAGTAIGSILFAAQRHVAQLHKWRSAIEAGAPFSVDSLQPPPHFRRKPAIEAALRKWTAASLAGAMAELAEAVLESRRMSTLAGTIGERALMSIALKGQRSAA